MAKSESKSKDKAKDKAGKGSSAVTQLTRRYTDAVDQARIIHGAHIRKGTTIPYVSHALFVSAIVLEYGGTEDQAIAGLLHDAAEDGGGQPRLDAIRAEFGDTVADIVADLSDSLTEDKSDKAPWLERKCAYLAHLSEVPERSLLVCAADKLANLTSVRADHRRLGAELWKRFNANSDRAGQLWYYRRISEILAGRLRKGRPAELAAELRSQVDELWVEVSQREGIDRDTLEGDHRMFSDLARALGSD